MQYHWIQDINDKQKLAKEHAYCIGSFINPEMVSKLEGSNQVESSDEEFDESFEMVRKAALEEEKNKEKKKRRRKIR